MSGLERGCGILLHVTSLPSRQGIGTFGEAAFRFVDFLAGAGQRYWQVLPLGMTGYGNSPYQSCSAFAGNINLIDLDILAQKGYLKATDYENINWGSSAARVDFGKVYAHREAVLCRAAEAFDANDAQYRCFCEENRFWLDDFALFMAIKRQHDMASFDTWEDGLKRREPDALEAFHAAHRADIEKIKIMQHWFYEQVALLRRYAHRHGVQLIGDIPFYVAYDSADVWANPQLFELNADLAPVSVAGVPPDAFSEDGQLWGNPLYNYAQMRRDGYAWWRSRVRQSFAQCDVLRIDHFRAFDSYYAVPHPSTNAKGGQWRRGEGMAMIEALGLTDLPIIAEDLGDLSQSARDLIRQTGFPNMKVLQFAFESDASNEFLPGNYDENCVVYTGTHDNNTVRGWYKSLPLEQKRTMARLAPYSVFMRKSEALIRCAQQSPARIAIIPMQDYLNRGASARMNMPSTMQGNWEWRALPGDFSAAMSEHIRKLCAVRNAKESSVLPYKTEKPHHVDIRADNGYRDRKYNRRRENE